jgi:putative transposase
LEAGSIATIDRRGEHFWQKRYYDFNVRNEPQFVEKLRYIHQNPVKRGLCARAEDWEWSSFRQYATGCAGRVEIECEWAARKRERAAGRLGPAAKPTQAKKLLE